jgi:hypothetical protein
MENSKLDVFRNSSDSIADKAVLELIKNDGHKAVYNFIATNRYNAQKIDSQSFPQLAALNNSVHQMPEWLNKKKMELAARFFEKYMPEILHTLGFLSLPYCYAASDGARVLALSKKISENPEKRLRDTATFVLELLSPDAFEQSGKGFASLLNTRLIHAATRYSILKSEQWKPEWGMPINQGRSGRNSIIVFLHGAKRIAKIAGKPEHFRTRCVFAFLGSLRASLGDYARTNFSQ